MRWRRQTIAKDDTVHMWTAALTTRARVQCARWVKLCDDDIVLPQAIPPWPPANTQMTRSHLRSRNLAAKRSPRPMKGRKKGDDEKNPISRFDPKAKAKAVTRRGTDEATGKE